MYSDFYCSQIKRIIHNLGETNIKYRDFKFLNFNVEFGIDVIKEFLNSLDYNYLVIFKQMLKDNLINISKNINNHEEGRYSFSLANDKYNPNQIKIMLLNLNRGNTYKSYSININCHNLESMLYLLSHELGHALSAYYSDNLPLEKNLTKETISQLFPLMLADFLKEKYPRISVNDKERENFNILMTSLKDIDEYKHTIENNGASKIKSSAFYEYADSYENKMTYIYSYFLANKLYENYKETNSLRQVNKLMLSSGESYDLNTLLTEINVDKRSIGTIKMIKRIKNRLK
jgi:hypothetical protein